MITTHLSAPALEVPAVDLLVVLPEIVGIPAVQVA
jgi:hypothetical protein